MTSDYPVESPILYDLEVYPGWFEAGFLLPSGEVRQYVVTPEDTSHLAPLAEFLNWVQFSPYPLCGFNSIGYDDPVLTAILNEKTCEATYRTSCDIIQHGIKAWSLPNDVNSVDLMQILPNRISLKKIGVCLGHKKLQELPVRFDKVPDVVERNVLLQYNLNDLEITKKLHTAILPELKLRQVMSEAYGVDMRSKGEAAMAEAALLSELKKRRPGVKKKDLNEESVEYYRNRGCVDVKPPFWWERARNAAPITVALGDDLMSRPIPIDLNTMKVKKGVIDKQVFIDDRYYQTGIGGLHSVDGAGCWIPKDDEVLMDIDVASYYPNLILTNKIYPISWGPVFLEIYRDIVERRMTAKKSGDKVTADVLKIVVNGTYGKTSEIFSSLYDPEVTVNTTVSGQLALLVLIEVLTGKATVCSANTDGMTVLCKEKDLDEVKGIVAQWEELTGLEMEYTQYAGIYQRSVNDYIAVKTAGKVKAKGTFLDAWPDLRHTPRANIVATAVQAACLKPADAENVIHDTIRGCTDINQFLLTHTVTGRTKTRWGDQALGKVLRFYKSNRPDAGPIMRCGDDGVESMVPDSESCVPLEDLPEYFPRDVNLAWYVNRAIEQWRKISVPKKPGMNRWAEVMWEMGLPAAAVAKDSELPLSRAAVRRGKYDFSSMGPGMTMGVKTGDGLLAKRDADGRVEFYLATKSYPGKTRALVMRDEGFELLYGPRVAHNGLVILNEELDFDKFYTVAELRKVGRGFE